MWKSTKHDGKMHVGRGRVSCVGPEMHVGRGVHASENARRDRCSRVEKHTLGDQCDSVPWIVSVSATIVRASGKRASGEVFTRRKTYVGRGLHFHASGSMQCTTDSVLLGHHRGGALATPNPSLPCRTTFNIYAYAHILE